MTVGAAVEWSCPEPDQGVIVDDDAKTTTTTTVPAVDLVALGVGSPSASRSARLQMHLVVQVASVDRRRRRVNGWMDGWMDSRACVSDLDSLSAPRLRSSSAPWSTADVPSPRLSSIRCYRSWIETTSRRWSLPF